jgi:hypothetical protein
MNQTELMQTIHELAVQMKETNQLLSQIVQINAALLESALEADPDEDEGVITTYLDGSPLKPN